MFVNIVLYCNKYWRYINLYSFCSFQVLLAVNILYLNVFNFHRHLTAKEVLIGKKLQAMEIQTTYSNQLLEFASISIALYDHQTVKGLL